MPIHVYRNTVRLLVVTAAIAASVTHVESEGTSPTLVFEDQSTLSGGPLDSGEPTSDTEKATGAWVDVNGDGWDDLITLTGAGQPCGYFLNADDGNGGRELVPAPAGNGLDDGAAMTRDGAAIAAGDVDLDGDIDLFVGTGLNPSIEDGTNLLLLNDGAGNFTDVAADLGVQDVDTTTAAVVLFDMDLDGDLDMMWANTNLPGLGKYGNGQTHLVRNLLKETGVLSFVEETDTRFDTVLNRGAWAIITPDFDDDGDPDVVFTRDIVGPTQLYENDGNGFFTNISRDVGIGEGDDETPSTFGDDTRSAMGADVADVNNDGSLEIYLTNINKNALYFGNGNGRLTELGETAGVRGGGVTWGCVFADFDLDGWVDLHVTAGSTYGTIKDNIPFLFHNRGDGTFDEVFETSGMRWDRPLHREGGSAFCDYDGDGRVDLLVVRTEQVPAAPYVYRNVTDTGDNRWITVRPLGNGTTSNTSAVGARIRVWPRDVDGNRIGELAQVHEVLACRSRSAVSSTAITFGLGCEAESVDVEVTWPRSGALANRRNLYTHLAVNQRVEFEDGDVDTVDPPPDLDPLSAASIIAGRTQRLDIPGSGDFETHPVMEVDSGPGWATTVYDETAGAWKLEVTPPESDARGIAQIVILANNPAFSGASSLQTVTLSITPPPVIHAITVKRKGRLLLIDGLNFERKLMEALVDGLPAKKVKVLRKPLELDGDSGRLKIKVPLSKSDRRGVHEVELRCLTTELWSDAVEYDAE